MLPKIAFSWSLDDRPGNLDDSDYSDVPENPENPENDGDLSSGNLEAFLVNLKKLKIVESVVSQVAELLSAPEEPTPASAPQPIPAYIEERLRWEQYHSTAPGTARRIALREAMILHYLPDAYRVAGAYLRDKMPQNSLLDQDDLRQLAMIGVIEAVDKYNPNYHDPRYSRPPTFMEFAARFYIEGRILDGLRTLMDFSRKISILRRQLKPIKEKLSFRFNRQPTKEEILTEIGTQDKALSDKWRKALYHEPLLESSVFNQTQEVSTGNSSRHCDRDSGSPYEIEDYRTPKRSSVEASDTEEAILKLFPDPLDHYIAFYSFYFRPSKNYRWIADHWTDERGWQVSISTITARYKQIVEVLREYFCNDFEACREFLIGKGP